MVMVCPQGMPTAVSAIPGIGELWAETLTHPCFSGAMLSELRTLASSGVGPGSACGHGTHIASVIFGQHTGPVLGVAPRCRGLVVPVFDDCEDGRTTPCSELDLARAIEQAADAGANVINISGGQPSASGEAHPLLADAVRKCAELGILIVAAAGNQGCACLHVPGALPAVITVGAMNHPFQAVIRGVER